MSLTQIINSLDRMSFANKVMVYIYLRNHLRLDESQTLFHRNASDPEFFTRLLSRKKELAIIELYHTVPYLHVNNFGARNAILKILPVFLSYSTLYEMTVPYASQILDMLKVHPAFSNSKIFKQWFVVFEKRRLNRTRVFSYKDEFYFHNLPPVEFIPGDYFSLCVGYSDIALLRAFHRWLRQLRLHKYLFVFANLTYEQIVLIDESNIDEIVASIGIIGITVGAKNKMLRELDELRKRETVLFNVIYKNYQSAQDIEEAIRVIKKTLRTPIKVTNNEFSQSIPDLLVKSLQKVCIVILSDIVPFDEEMIPVYGLLISVLKEAWNYTIFSSASKDWFNDWRNALSEKINNCISVQSQFLDRRCP